MANAHDTHHEGNHGSVKSYMIGFVLSIILTAIPFGLAMSPPAEEPDRSDHGGHGVIQVLYTWFTSCTWTARKSSATTCRRSCSPRW
jgi:hypothetical protein